MTVADPAAAPTGTTTAALDEAALLLCGRAGEGVREEPCFVHRDDAAELIRRYLDALDLTEVAEVLRVTWPDERPAAVLRAIYPGGEQ